MNESINESIRIETVDSRHFFFITHTISFQAVCSGCVCVCVCVHT